MTEILVSDAAERAELSEAHIRRLLKDHQKDASKGIAGRKVDAVRGSYWVVDVDDLDRYVNDWKARKPGAPRKDKSA